MLKKIVIILCILGVTEGQAQKLLQKELAVAGVDVLQIDAPNVYKISVTSEKRNTITIQTKVEGEVAENMMIEVLRDMGTTTIRPGFSPYFTPENDKLAAHKVLAIEMEIRVPVAFNVSVVSNSAVVFITGNYALLQVALVDGACTLSDFRGDGKLFSKWGDILVTTPMDNVSTFASSQYGTVINELREGNHNQIIAESIAGDITLRQTK